TYARKIVTHDKYSFYNPKQHPMFDKRGGRVIYFEGTYTNTFSGNPDRTPRYNYNQILYRLDLADPRLALPVPVHRVTKSNGSETLALRPDVAAADKPGEIACFALDRPGKRTVPVYRVTTGDGVHVLTLDPKSIKTKRPLPSFHALPADGKPAPGTTVPLFEFIHKRSGVRVYSTEPESARSGYRRNPRPLCRVWKNPSTVPFPLSATRANATR
ncbi:MAG: hypothetical protein ACE5KM_04960, partial [Planctomycetaceae bacterium]